MKKNVRWGNGWALTEIEGERQIGEQVFAIAKAFPESSGAIAHRLGDSDDWETIGWNATPFSRGGFLVSALAKLAHCSLGEEYPGHRATR